MGAARKSGKVDFVMKPRPKAAPVLQSERARKRSRRKTTIAPIAVSVNST
jgi:hypothetical protein